MKFQTKEWIDAVQAKSLVDEAYQKKTKGFTLATENVITDCPGDVDRRAEWHFQDGKIVNVVFLIIILFSLSFG